MIGIGHVLLEGMQGTVSCVRIVVRTLCRPMQISVFGRVVVVVVVFF